MIVSRFIIAATLVASAVSASSASAQGCTGTTSCDGLNTASVTIGALIRLGISANTTTLTAPVYASLGSFVADAGPTFTVHANQNWILSIKSGNATNWTYVSGGNSGVKAIGDLNWAATDVGSFIPLTTTGAQLATGSATDTDAPAVFFQTAYNANSGDASNRAGVYSLPVVFTLTAP